MKAALSSVSRFGLLANLSALGSLLMCFGQAALASLLTALAPATRVSMSSVPHVQAVLMWALAALVVIGLLRDRGRHGSPLPSAVATAATLIMVATLYFHYHWAILSFAYICLIAAVFLNQTTALAALYRTIRQQASELESWNSTLQQRVDAELAKNERLERLRGFLSPQVAALVTAAGNEQALSSNRRRIAVVFCDLRGFTEFSDAIEPEEAMEVLQQYHEALGRLVFRFDGTIDHRAGDGLVVLFNAPMEIEQPVRRAVEMAAAMRATIRELCRSWDYRHRKLGFGIGITYGFATLGVVGYEGRYDYTANGNVVNLAARLCDQAGDGQIIVSQQAYAEIRDGVEARPLGALTLKGFRDPVAAFDVVDVLDGGDVRERVDDGRR